MEIHHPSIIFAQPTPDTQQQQQQQSPEQQLPQPESSFIESSHQDLLSTEEILNIVPTDTVGSAVDHVHPLPDHSSQDDFLNEEEVFESILDGEQQNDAIISSQPLPAVQNNFG